MNNLKTLLSVFIFLSAGLVYSSSANAANETATAEMEITSKSGGFYKEAFRPVSLHIGVEVKSPYPENAFALPMKQVKIRFPSGLKFIPNNTPACTKINKTTNTASDATNMIKNCPRSLVASGDAGLYLARTNWPQPNLTDPVLLAFYGGKTNAGEPIIKITGFSRSTGAGIYMQGAVKKDNTLTLNVPVLSYDSAVGYFNLDFPGTFKESVQSFAQAKCASSPFRMNASFILGTRNPSTGTPSGPDVPLVAPETTQDCVGAVGTAQSRATIKGPGIARKGQIKNYRITVRNPGTATLKNVRVKTFGRWLKGRNQSLGNIYPGASKTVVAKVRVLRSAKSGRVTVLKARVSAGNTSAKNLTKRVRVK